MEKVWLNGYPPGIPTDIDMSECASLNDLLAQSCRDYSARPAFKNLGRTITYAQVDALTRDFGAWLQHVAGNREGVRVAIILPNTLQYPIAMFGALRAGMVVVNTNPLYTAGEMERQLADSGAEIAVVWENSAHALAEVVAHTSVRHVVMTQIGDLLGLRGPLVNAIVRRRSPVRHKPNIPGAIGFSAVLHAGRSMPLREPPRGHDDLAFLQYTGGTTGISKAAELTHGNMVANVLQAEAWLSKTLDKGAEVVVTALPLYHVFSLTANCLYGCRMGALNLLITDPRNIKGFVKELRGNRFTIITGVNTLFNALLNAPGFKDIDFSQLRCGIAGGAALHGAVAERWRAVTGRWVVEGYGLTEASPLVSCNICTDPRQGSIGLAFPATDIAIRDDDGNDLPIGSHGELCVRGPQVMRGYWKRPDETAAVLDADGWLRTGDIASMDESGYVRISDRKKDLILVSGFNVYPNEVEEVISQMPEVLECAVASCPSETTGEMVRAYVVPRGETLSAEYVIEFCRTRLTAYKVPKSVVFVSELPKNPIGKVLRRELRAMDVAMPAPFEQMAFKANP